MSPKSQEAYQSNQVLTASPYKLRLMLIDGALRHALAAKGNWEAEDRAPAEDSLGRCRKIIAELLRSAASCDDAVARQVSSVYSYVMRTLTEARSDRQIAKLDDVIRVLRVERETWQAVCDQFGAETGASLSDGFSSEA
jgi:flagellar protein FliS